MRNLKETFLSELRIPDINGERCVHAHIETASCKACVDACPENAWLLDDESLGLNTSACDGCGLCVPACTEGAITQLQNCTIREQSSREESAHEKNPREENNDGKNNKKALLLGCDQTGLRETNCKCVHAFTYGELLKLHRDGIQHLFVKTGDCDHCPRGKNESLAQRIENLNSMLSSHYLPLFRIKQLPTNLWRQLWKAPEKAAPGPEMSRRLFFRSAIKQTLDKVLHHSSFESNGEFIPLGKLLPVSDLDSPGLDCSNLENTVLKETVFAAVPMINPAKCNGCDACIKACPHHALQIRAEAQAGYYIDATACTACNICVDICDQDAVQVSQWSRSKQGFIPLDSQRCNSCGAVFHYPLQPEEISGKGTGDSRENKRCLCNICNQVNHQKNLFQVLD